MVFTKFQSCLAGPHAGIPLGSEQIDFEIELCVVIGKRAEHMAEARALEYVAGYWARTSPIAACSSRAPHRSSRFTGTPSGVGSMRSPCRYLKAGDVVRSEIPGIGVLENRCIAGPLA